MPISSSAYVVFIIHLFCYKHDLSYTLGYTQGHKDEQDLTDVFKELALQASVSCRLRISSNN